MTSKVKTGPALRAYLAASYLVPLLATPILARRRERGKEHATRWVEKQGRGLAVRPDRRLIWLHAVGLGEVMSLRGLIARLAEALPNVQFLVTSSTAASARVFGDNLPPRTMHQFLPLDAPVYRQRFLDHFRPDLCIWAEQDLWPGFVHDLHRRGVPQAIVAARMNDAAFARHRKAAGLYRDLYARLALITAQDAVTAAHLATLGADVRVSGSLKPAAPALGCDAVALQALRDAIGARFVWAVAPSHPADEAAALAAHEVLRAQVPDALLIVAPRHPDRADLPGPAPRKSQGTRPGADDPLWICDTFGDLGLVYRVADAVLIGGTFDATEGHNPWEAAQLHCAVLHGPQMANFAADFATLDAAGGAMAVADAEAITAALLRPDLAQVAGETLAAAQEASLATDMLANDLAALLKPRHE
ncbi:MULTISPECIES: 3-deoxy-D-manno-octulosonic acid transferase [unclassified Yoonia]|uniref:3-deoxy-D-manno-octulosonic acid transferase n=1 Tax=unclassified Yoonia TaxID=2629118 RepID=UPI002AFFF60D|nr:MULTISPECIES: glycosyltransferase N-terminal domain-containing protein [unclassified Yoonia]